MSCGYVPVNSLLLRDASDWVGEFSLAERSMSESFSVWFRALTALWIKDRVKMATAMSFDTL
jgi:hypothetical protein